MYEIQETLLYLIHTNKPSLLKEYANSHVHMVNDEWLRGKGTTEKSEENEEISFTQVSEAWEITRIFSCILSSVHQMSLDFLQICYSLLPMASLPVWVHRGQMSCSNVWCGSVTLGDTSANQAREIQWVLLINRQEISGTIFVCTAQLYWEVSNTVLHDCFVRTQLTKQF